MMRLLLKAFNILVFFLLTVTLNAHDAPIQFIDQLASTEREKVTAVVRTLLQNPYASGTALFPFLSEENNSPTTVIDSFQMKDLIPSTGLYCDEIPTLVLNSTDSKDRLISFLNLLGFAGKYFDQPVNSNTALTQYLPEVHIRTVHGVKNIFFTDPAFTDANFADTIGYYDSINGLSHLIPLSVSPPNKRLHDALLAYAFSGKTNPDLKVSGLCNRGLNGTRIPVVELIGRFLAEKVKGHITGTELVIFSGTGFSGAVAQEVVYHLKLESKDLNLSVVTTQAMRYLAGDFVKDYDHVLGWKNVWSINTERNWSAGLPSGNYQSIYFDCLGQKIRLELKAPSTGWWGSLTQKVAFLQGADAEKDKGIIFKGQTNPEARLGRVVTKIQRSGVIENRDFARLVQTIESLPKSKNRLSSNALAMVVSSGFFLKTSKGQAEHKNIATARQLLKIDGNFPALFELTDTAKMVVPASYYDPIHDVSLTVAHAVGNKTAHDKLANILDKKDFTIAASSEGCKLGQILAALHAKTDYLCHGDFHLNNIRFDENGNAFVIDIETLAHSIIDGNYRDRNGLRDILDLIAKTTSHIYKSSLYGANKGWGAMVTAKDPSATEKAFAVGVLKGYLGSIDADSLNVAKRQYRDFRMIYQGDVNKYLNDSYFSTYDNSIFHQIFLHPDIKSLLEES